MAEEKARPWWKVKRVQGLVVMAAGAIMTLIPVTAPAAPTVITIGTAWAGIGGVDAVRKSLKSGGSAE
jgi:hypothetical protein